MNKKVLTIIITFLVIAGLVAGAVFFLGKKNKNTSEKPAETTTEKVTEEVTEAPTEDATEEPTTKEEPTEEESGETESKVPAEGLEIGAVMTPEILYGDKLDDLVYELQFEPRNYKEHLEFTKEISSDIATKYRSEYIKDLENIPFDASYIVDEDSKKYFTDKPIEELKELVYGAGEVAQKFAAVYFTNDCSGPVYGYPTWEYRNYVYKDRVTAEHVNDVDILFILGMKMVRLDLRVGPDGTVEAFAYFVGYGVDSNDDSKCHDKMFSTKMRLVCDKTDNTWYIWDTVESYDGFTKSIVSTDKNGVAQKISPVDYNDKSVTYKAIIGESNRVWANINRE